MIPPAWLTRVVSLATEQGRNFKLRPLDQREQYQLEEFYLRGTGPYVAAAYLNRNLGPLLLDGPIGGVA